MARNIGVNFNGQRIVHPSAHAKIDASALNSVGSSTNKIVALIGNAEGGIPNEIYTITSSAEAVEIFKGGDLVKACELAFNPSGDAYGAGTIIAMRAVTGCEQAKLEKGGLVIKAKNHGANGNNIHIDFNGNDKLVVMDVMTGEKEVYDELGTIVNISGAKVEITGIDVKTLKVGEKSIELVGIYEDINQVIKFINDNGGKASLASSSHKSLKASELDVTAGAVDVLTAKIGDIVHQTQVSNLIEVTKGSGEVAVIDDKLAGGADGTLSITADVLAKLNGEGTYIIVPLTDDETAQNAVHNYVNEQSQDERSLMLGVYGGAVDETVDGAIERALSFSSSRAIVAYPPILKATTDNNPEQLPAYMTASLIAGRIAGKETGDPITLDSVNINGLVKTPSKAEVNRMIEAGVTTIEFVRNSGTKGYRIAQGLTTYQGNSNPNYREIGMRIVSDEMIGELVERLETNFVGGKGTKTTVALIKNDIQSFLDQKVREEVIVEYDPNSVTVQLQGDVVYVTFSCVPVGAINYILVTTKYTQASLLA